VGSRLPRVKGCFHAVAAATEIGVLGSNHGIVKEKVYEEK
jgi:hypothetical protein